MGSRTLAILMIAMWAPGALMADATTGTDYGGITFPDGAVSFADVVVSFDPVIIGGEPNQGQNPNAALGIPQGASSTANHATLGVGGSITLEFVDNVLTGSGDNCGDLHIFEVGGDVEDTDVEISKDGIVWEYVGKVTGSTDSVDIDAFGFGAADQFRFVRLTDDPLEGNTVGGTVGADIDAVGAISSSLPPLLITMHRLEASGVRPSSLMAGLDSDTPPALLPSVDPAVLRTQPILLAPEDSNNVRVAGLVTDGVTPLLFRIQAESATPVNVSWASTELRGSVTGGVENKMFQLQNGLWVAATGALTLETGSEAGVVEGFLYLQALDTSDVQFTSDSEVDVTLTADTTGGDVGNLDFKLRPPPVVLLPDLWAGEWSQTVMNELEMIRPAGFVEIGRSSEFSALGKNNDRFKNTWAITRHDIVVHGRNALRARMESEASGSGISGYRNAENFYRGYWRRIVSVGAPHNGSLLSTYIRSLNSFRELPRLFSGSSNFSVVANAMNGFFNLEPREATLQNLRFPHDPAARFAFIGTTIGDTDALYKGLGLRGTRLSRVLPAGSDGLVDLNSMLVGGGQEVAGDIAHFDLGGPPSQSVQLESPAVAVVIRNTIDDASKFQRFIVPPLPTELELERIRQEAVDSVASEVATVIDILGNSPIQLLTTGGLHTFDYELIPPLAAPVTGEVNWFAEIYAPDGITTDGVSLIVNPSDAKKVTVNVSGTVVGDVVLHCAYETSGDKTGWAEPLLVTTCLAPGETLSSIELQPTTIDLAVREVVRPDVVATYSGGSNFTKFIPAADLTVAANSSVLDVTNPLAWEAVGVGDVDVTVTYMGLSATSEVRVGDFFSPETLIEWKAKVLNPAQFADPEEGDPESDTDFDQLNLAMEYVTAGLPRVAEPGHRPRVERMEVNGTEQPVLVVRVSSTLSGVTAEIQEMSTSGGGWQTWFTLNGAPSLSDPKLIDYSDGGSYYELFLDVSANPAAYYRLVANGDFGFVGLQAVSGCTELIFTGSGNPVSLAYGDRVTGTTVGGFTYGGTTTFTPNVVTNYPEPRPRPWVSGYGDLTNVLYSLEGEIRIQLKADPGYVIVLEHLDLAAFTGSFGSDPTIDSLEVVDGAGNVLFSQANIVVSRTTRTSLDFTASPLIGEELEIRTDSTNLGTGLRDEIALDNVRFCQAFRGGYGNATELVFEQAGAGFGTAVDPAYGNRVSAAVEGNFSYLGAGQFTPGVEIEYGPSAAAPRLWPRDFGDLNDVVYDGNGNFNGILEITFRADAGKQVRLFRFDMAATSVFAEDPAIDEVSVRDGSGFAVFDATDVVISKEASTRFDFTSSPIQGSTITIRFDASNLANLADEIGIDNILIGEL